MLTDDQIEEVLHQEPTAINLIEAAKEAGGRDNVSVVLLRVTRIERGSGSNEPCRFMSQLF